MGALAFPPDVESESARLPALYENAKKALSECNSVDECQNWANRAEALASYAKQAKDYQLRNMAERIQGRAMRRCGELLNQVQSAKGGDRRSDQYTSSGTLVTRTSVASDAGLSKRQKDTALRVANIPEQDFNAAVESDHPPTLTVLAKIGTQSKPKPLVDLEGIPPKDYARATEAQGTLREFARFCQVYEPLRIARAFKKHEIAELRQWVSIVDSWLDRFVTNLEG